ncbi:TadE-like protein [Duganella sp. CF402]|uniref:TadE/TadG family type IV pilus assembly protein n=1 Tax=unclassified Duganella TaxID=2636909 RepID=UPI0008B1E452|nr:MULTISPECIES: TadE/TadG family type IV pilus assembly protein [unclassified Duganella]RZT09298.1 TadE-like protein [Duganella sp. BK701]SEL62712.1 TadE-like protein [Duganella sp. CF402]
MRRQRGMVALELALVLPILLALLTAVVYYGRLTYTYAVTQKAAAAGTRYLSSVAPVNLKSPVLASQESLLAQALVQSELSALGLTAAVEVDCDGISCNMLGNVPAEVSTTIVVWVPNILPGYLPELTEQRLVIRRSTRYVGN